LPTAITSISNQARPGANLAGTLYQDRKGFFAHQGFKITCGGSPPSVTLDPILHRFYCTVELLFSLTKVLKFPAAVRRFFNCAWDLSIAVNRQPVASLARGLAGEDVDDPLAIIFIGQNIGFFLVVEVVFHIFLKHFDGVVKAASRYIQFVFSQGVNGGVGSQFVIDPRIPGFIFHDFFHFGFRKSILEFHVDIGNSVVQSHFDGFDVFCIDRRERFHYFSFLIMQG
jgi:hypothetical protein